MSRTGIRIEGFDDADDNLDAIANALSDDQRVAPLLLDALEPVAERARQIVPVKTGRLRGDIGTSERADGEEMIGDHVAYVGPSIDADYAEEIEFGRPAGVTAKGREWDAVEPHPYMRPAWDAEEGQILPRLAEGLGRLAASTVRK